MRKLVFVFVFILTLSACMPSVHVMRYTAAIYPPSSNVEILRTKPADREYFEIGEISLELNAFNRKNAVFILSEEARKLGADALVLLGEKGSGAMILPVGKGYTVINTERLVGVAIKFK